jgi:hypothetical protein
VLNEQPVVHAFPYDATWYLALPILDVILYSAP